MFLKFFNSKITDYKNSKKKKNSWKKSNGPCHIWPYLTWRHSQRPTLRVSPTADTAETLEDATCTMGPCEKSHHSETTYGFSMWHLNMFKGKWARCFSCGQKSSLRKSEKLKDFLTTLFVGMNSSIDVGEWNDFSPYDVTLISKAPLQSLNHENEEVGVSWVSHGIPPMLEKKRDAGGIRIVPSIKNVIRMSFLFSRELTHPINR